MSKSHINEQAKPLENISGPATRPILSFSIVSHGQSSLIRYLLDDLTKLSLSEIEIIITINIPEDERAFANLPYPTRIIRNPIPKGFGANHNQAFTQSLGRYFIIVNPDIRLPSLKIVQLLQPLEDKDVGAVAPVVLNSAGSVEDSVRRFPTVMGLARRVLLRQRSPGYIWMDEPIIVDWAAGMFVVFRREAYEAVRGFDHRRFFMYFEDADICRRLHDRGWKVVLQPSVSVIHDAQRASHRSLKHLRWHVTSALRYLSGF